MVIVIYILRIKQAVLNYYCSSMQANYYTTMDSLLQFRLIWLLVVVKSVCCSNVLISALYGEGSHFMAAAAVGKGLVERGHNVTCLIGRAYEGRASDPKYADLSFEIFDHHTSAQEIRELFSDINTLAFKNTEDQLIGIIKLFTETLGNDCQVILENAELVRRLESIDAIIMDVSWPCGLLLKSLLESNHSKKLAAVSITPTVPEGHLLYLYGSFYNPAFQPEVMTGFTNKMSFLQRIGNVFQSSLDLVLTYMLILPMYRKVAMNVGIDPLVVYPRKAFEKYDLHLLSMDFSSEFPFPLAPGFIPVGGLTARPRRQLSEDLEEFMQSSGDHGVIVFTLGTYFASVTDLRPDFVEAFAEVFRRLPQKVIWQLKTLPNVEISSNVKIMPWVPQNDLLGHPKTRVFMFHGGNNGFQEACYHGVPIVVIPFLGDQYDVGARVESRGMGRRVDKYDINADIIYEALSDVINDPKYAAVAKEVAAIRRNNPMEPRDRAAYWVEHVIKFGGDYLKTPVYELSFIQYYMLDVLALILIIITLTLAVSFYCLRFCVNRCLRLISFGQKLKQA